MISLLASSSICLVLHINVNSVCKQEAHGTKDLPGIIVGVADVDGEIYFKGSRNKVIRDPTSGEIDADSVLWICSQTKMITAVCHHSPLIS